MRLMMDHLVGEHRYSRIGFVGISVGKQYEDRLEAWRAELGRRGLAEDPAMVGILEALEQKEVSRWVDALCDGLDLRERRSVDALVTVSDVAASSVIEELGRRGIRVPRDIAVTGFNNQLQSVSAPCPITTVDLGYFQRGYTAVELLLDLIEDPSKRGETQIVDSTLVIRQSCGCFEDSIKSAGAAALNRASRPDSNPARASGLREALMEGARAQAPGLSSARIEGLADAVLADLGRGGGDGLLVWLQGTLTEESGLSSSRVEYYQNLISSLRRAAIADTARDPEGIVGIENVFHQARALISASSGYYEKSHQTDAYRFNNLARIAISFASALSGAEVLEAIRYHLGELDMPGIMLVLQEELLPDLGNASLEFVHPPSYIQSERLPFRISKASFVPRSLFPQGKPWAMKMEILYYSGLYMGYALMQMGPANVALYDAVRTLLSHSLYAVYVREGRNSLLRENLLQSEKVSSILSAGMERAQGRLGIGPQRIVDYLMDHLGEMTDLDAMARDLSISKFHLIRRTKALTGYTVQALHELLKIERGKTMLETRSIKISEIASRLGYQSQGYFSSVFKKNTGMSPKDWINRGN